MVPSRPGVDSEAEQPELGKPQEDCEFRDLHGFRVSPIFQRGMNRGISAAAEGMRANQLMLDVLANNIANQSTVGFKADGIAFRETLESRLSVRNGRFERPIGEASLGGAKPVQFTIDSVGPIVATGNPMDLALRNADQYFAVSTPQGIRYTRDGGIRPNTQGVLVTRDGYPVLDVSGSPITLTGAAGAKIEFTPNGAVLENGIEIGLLDIREGEATKVGSNLWAGQLTQAATPSIEVGALENSNVSVLEAMVQMISIMRQFESAQKAIHSQDEMTGQLIQSLATR